MTHASILHGTHIAQLPRFFDAGIQLVTVPFPIPPQAVTALESKPAGWTWQRIVPVDPEGAPQSGALSGLGPDDGPSGQLRALVVEALDVLGCLFGGDELGVRLTDATKAPCPRFHVDHVLARTVVTLAGPGSEYLLPDEVNREKMGHGANGLPDERSGLIRPGARPHRVEGGRLCLFKGEAWPGNKGQGLVHRSPPIGGEPRWLMTIDLL